MIENTREKIMYIKFVQNKLNLTEMHTEQVKITFNKTDHILIF